MITATQQKIRDKTITAKQWADMVKSGDWMTIGSVGGDATGRRYPDYRERRDFKIPYASVIWGYEWADDVWSGK